jgi:hypothetical protein
MVHSTDRSTGSLRLHRQSSVFILLFVFFTAGSSLSWTPFSPILHRKIVTEQTEIKKQTFLFLSFRLESENRRSTFPLQHFLSEKETLRHLPIHCSEYRLTVFHSVLQTFENKRQSSFHPRSFSFDSSHSPSDTRLG